MAVGITVALEACRFNEGKTSGGWKYSEEDTPGRFTFAGCDSEHHERQNYYDLLELRRIMTWRRAT